MKEFNPFSLKDKTILVTGASSGIGRAIAIACAGMGASVVITGRNKQRLQETLALMNAGNHQIIQADLTNKEEIDSLVTNLPKLDGLVQCAGVGNRVLCKSINESDLQQVFQPNVVAPILLQTAILEKKAEAERVIYMSPQDRSTKSFSDFVEKENIEEIDKLIQEWS
jgi:short-subunit dehydrogenase